ncbi:septal ring lytic transglycosylase RlpA family lipoprotein, partial [Helicobacter pylori]
MGLALKKVCFLGVIFLISACTVKKEGVKNLSYKHESLRAYENAKDYDPTTKKAAYKRNFFERHFKRHSNSQNDSTKTQAMD